MAECMESFKTIMLATDLSDASCGALSYATRLASRLSAKLLIVHVVDPDSGSATCDEKTIHFIWVDRLR